MNRIAVITDAAVGGTFLSWSLHWLSGQSTYFSAKQRAEMLVTADPVNEQNSHNFVANHATTLNLVSKYLKFLPQTGLQHIYFHQLKNAGPYSYQQSLADTAEAINLASAQCDRVVVVSLPESYKLYHCKLASRNNVHTRLKDGSVYYSTDYNQILDDFLEFFFSENLKIWRSQNLNNIWDQREFLALNIRPFDRNSITQCHSFDFSHFALPADKSWLELDQHILDILDYCKIPLDQSKYQQWITAYKQWQALHTDRIQFCRIFDQLIDAILTNKPIDLIPLNLDIVREAAIQHCLIYKHNLNFKTWQLEKFTNTQQLHQLLEPNIHPLEKN